MEAPGGGSSWALIESSSGSGATRGGRSVLRRGAPNSEKALEKVAGLGHGSGHRKGAGQSGFFHLSRIDSFRFDIRRRLSRCHLDIGDVAGICALFVLAAQITSMVA